ncbi:MAG: uracil-DNA glycosylase [Fusobacteriaceae bacterium]
MLEINLEESWRKLLQEELKKDYFINLMNFLEYEYKNENIFPKKENIFNLFNKIKFNDIKVVILGQDPYHGENQGNGIAFSVNENIKIPPSLRNIYKELELEYRDTNEKFVVPNHGNLLSLVEQGVFLLNTVLTVREGVANSHAKQGWELFTDEIINLIGKKEDSVVFILWGNQAKLKSKLIKNKNHLIIEGVHPSPLSANRGFFNKNYFVNTNKFLISKNKAPINWNIRVEKKTKGTFVLVHGAGVGGWVYRDVSRLLKTHGYEVYSPTLTGLGEYHHLLNNKIDLSCHIKNIVEIIIDNNLENVYLVGHSYGGAVISGVVDKISERIKKQIYLDSFFLENNESILDIFGEKQKNKLLKIVNREGQGWFLPWEYFGKNSELIKNMPWKPYTEKIKLSGAGEKIPGVFIDCTNSINFEHLVEPKKNMKKKIEKRKWEYYTLDSDHIPMTKSPQREMLVEILLKIVKD